jgi:hypothetical protein
MRPFLMRMIPRVHLTWIHRAVQSKLPRLCDLNVKLEQITDWSKYCSVPTQMFAESAGGRAPKLANSAVRDAVEFARLASKRWRYYRRTIRSVESIEAFKTATNPKNQEESSLILVARAPWFSATQPMGLAQCRRTFCNHLVLDFLTVHPKILLPVGEPIRGIGSGLIFALSALAIRFGVPLIWGEATALSAPFYERVFETPGIKDHFLVGQPILNKCANKFEQDLTGTLD